jgi:predicted KAP-like P-loop ATPase
MLHRAEDPDAFGQALVNMADSRLPSGRTRASVMLDELIGQAEKGFAQEHIAGVVGSLIDIGDRLWIGTDNDRNPFGTDNPSRITALVGDLLRRLSDDDRLPTMMKAVEGAASVTTPVLIVRRLESGLGVPVEKSIGELSPGQVQEEGGFVTATGALQLEQSAVHRIKEGAQRDELLAAPKLLYVLGEWTRWGDLADVKAWMDSVRSDDRQLARFLLAVRSLHVSERRRYYRINPRWFDGYVIPHELAKDVSRLAQAAEGETRECCDQFLKELQLIDAGKNPDELFDEDWA